MSKRILVALDSTAMSHAVFAKALAIAKATESRLRILHILPLTQETLQACSGHLTDFTPFLFDQNFDQRGDLTHEEQRFRQYMAEAIHAGVPTEFFRYAGVPGQIICNFALVWEADLIVIGRRNHPGLSELFLGSVSDYVVHHAPCSVHIVHHSEQDLFKPTQQQMKSVY